MCIAFSRINAPHSEDSTVIYIPEEKVLFIGDHQRGERNMAKYEKRLKGNFDEFLRCVNSDILNGSASVSFEDGSDVIGDSFKLAVRVYERYSMAGGNRVSMNVTILGVGDDLFISGITSGGSQAVFFKINTLGEETFLDIMIESVERFVKRNQA